MAAPDQVHNIVNRTNATSIIDFNPKQSDVAKLSKDERVHYVETYITQPYKHTLQKSCIILSVCAMEECLNIIKVETLKYALEIIINKKALNLSPVPQLAALYGSLHQLKPALTLEILTYSNPNVTIDGNVYSTLESAYLAGNADQISPELLQEEIIFPKETNQSCPAIIATRSNNLNQIPPQLLTFENITKSYKAGQTVIENATIHRQLQHIPTGPLIHQHKHLQQLIENFLQKGALHINQDAQQRANDWILNLKKDQLTQTLGKLNRPRSS
jgi:hypothetical protein